MGHGGDTISRKSIISVLFALSLVAGFIPLIPAAEAVNTEETNNALIKSHVKDDEVVKVNAAKKYKKYKKTYKKSYKKYRKSYAKYKYKKSYKKYYKYKYRYKKVRATSTYRYSSIGDCWAMSNHLYGKLTKAGKKVRIIQYRTSMSSRHRTVQVYSSGKWVDYNYRSAGLNKIYHATSSKPGLSVVKSS